MKNSKAITRLLSTKLELFDLLLSALPKEVNGQAKKIQNNLMVCIHESISEYLTKPENENEENGLKKVNIE